MRIFLLLVLFLPSLTWAAVYKCDVNGKLVYQQTPCADGGNDTLRINKAPSDISNAGDSGIRASERQFMRDREELKRERKARRQQQITEGKLKSAKKEREEQRCARHKADEDYYDRLARATESRALKKRYRIKADYYGDVAKSVCK